MNSTFLVSSPCDYINYSSCHLAVLLWKIFSPILLVLGLTGNCISLAVWSRKRMRSSTTSLYPRVLAAVDTLVLIVAPLRELIFYSTNIDIQVINNFTCRFHSWIAFTVTALSAWVLSALSVDRLIFVKFPIWAKSNCSKKLAAYVVLVITLLIVFINLHMLFYLDRHNIHTEVEGTNTSVLFDHSCLPYSDQYFILWYHVWPFTVLILYSIGPTICLITCSTALLKTLSARNVVAASITESRSKNVEGTSKTKAHHQNMMEEQVRYVNSERRESQQKSVSSEFPCISAYQQPIINVRPINNKDQVHSKRQQQDAGEQ